MENVKELAKIVGKENLNLIYRVFSPDCPVYLSDLLKIAYPSGYRCVDTSLPQEWYNKAQEMGIDCRFWVWSYHPDDEAPVFGKPVNVLEKVYNRIYGSMTDDQAQQLVDLY